MMIACQGFADAAGLHDSEADAIGKRPGFVGAFCIELQAGIKLGLQIGDDCNVVGAAKRANKVFGGLAHRWITECIGHFNQHPVRRQEIQTLPARATQSRSVKLITPIQKGDELVRVGKDFIHSRGFPWA